LDWVIERKGGDDLVSSIMDGRYNRQKILMTRCGLLTPCYAVEGDLNLLPSCSKAAKTATCETEIWSGALQPPVLLSTAVVV
jgi:ERCC4-type nuclease